MPKVTCIVRMISDLMRPQRRPLYDWYTPVVGTERWCTKFIYERGTVARSRALAAPAC
jgi:hypothetical protein